MAKRIRKDVREIDGEPAAMAHGGGPGFVGDLAPRARLEVVIEIEVEVGR
jgi:hypothetical protein